MCIKDRLALPSGPHLGDGRSATPSAPRAPQSFLGACGSWTARMAAQHGTCSLRFASARKQEDGLAGYLFAHSSPRF